MTLFIYRGVLQQSRLRLIIDSLAAGESDQFIWLNTNPVHPTSSKRLASLISHLTRNVEVTVLDGRWSNALQLRREIRNLIGSTAGRTVIIGQSALPLLPLRLSRYVLCVNGIPEERILQVPSNTSRATARALWVLYRAMTRRPRQNLYVTVSSKMSELVRERLGASTTIQVPTAVPEEYFVAPLTPTKLRQFDFCYQGSGAPWQNIERLSRCWSWIARHRPSATFLVVSTDPRCDVLRSGVSASQISFVSASSPADMATVLGSAKIGWVLREDHVVNRVSFPTKVGECLASGQFLIMSHIDWDPASILLHATPSAGILVEPSTPDEEIALAALRLLDSLDIESHLVARLHGERLRATHLTVVMRMAAEQWERRTPDAQD